MNDTTNTTVEARARELLPQVWSERDAFELALRQAKVYAASTIVPKDYQDNLPNCLIAMNMAKRIGADIMQTMQSLNIIYGRPGWSAQFLIATFNQCGKYSALRYEWTGEKGTDEWGCRAWAIEKATKERIEGPWVTLGLVRKEGWFDRKDKNGAFVSKWRTMPELMFHYRAAAFLVRTHAPELAMGLQTVEEINDTIIDITPERTHAPEPSQPSAIDKAKADIAARLKTIAPEAAPESIAAVAEHIANAGKPSHNQRPPRVGETINIEPPPNVDADGVISDVPPIVGDLVGVTFATIADGLRKAKTTDEADLAGGLIPAIADEQQRAELDVEYRAARKRLQK